MQVYKVGGAVRDHLLGFPHSEIDWVVVGATAAQMVDAGFTQVGRDFPVFLHPQTKSEYALARTERKSGQGYHGFVVHAEPTVTLEQDLQRRDLTINAMAMTADGIIIDPYGGQQDLARKLLRHVSPHFVEDPLRVLRVARFAARYAHLGFSVAPETLELMAAIVAQGELTHLSVERVWVETERALSERDPQTFFQVLQHCGALEALMPGITTNDIEALNSASASTKRTDCRWAALLANTDLACTSRINRSLKTPKRVATLATAVVTYRPALTELTADAVYALLKGLDALRRDEPFNGFCETVAALAGSRADSHPPSDRLQAARDAAAAVRADDVAKTGLKGPALGEAIAAAQQKAIDAVLRP